MYSGEEYQKFIALLGNEIFIVGWYVSYIILSFPWVVYLRKNLIKYIPIS